MATPIRIKDELAMLQTDANKVIQDIGKISAQLKNVTVERAEEAKQDMEAALKEQMSQIQKRLSEINDNVAKYSQKVDEQVKRNPYAFIGAALGAGFLLGKIGRIRSR